MAGILELMGLSTLGRQMAGRVARNWRERVGLARRWYWSRNSCCWTIRWRASTRVKLAVVEFLARLSHGLHPWPGRKMTLVVATDDFRPWKDQGRQFALIKDKSWHGLGGAEQLSSSDEPLLRELLAAEFMKP